MKYAAEIYGCAEPDIEGKQLDFLARNGSGKRPHRTDHQPIPRLEHGRWLCDCPCGSGAGITRNGIAHCFECGAIMQVASWPSKTKRDRVSKKLEKRADHQQNWKIDQPEPAE